MGFAEDKVYDYIMRNLKDFKNIQVASLADSLSCLTDADRDELHSREETRGSQATAYRFYQHLRCRQGWVPDLIAALRHNNAGHLAQELQHVYDSWQTHPPAPTAASFQPVVSGARPTTSSSAQGPSLGPGPAPSATQAGQPSPDLPSGGQPPLLPAGGQPPLLPAGGQPPLLPAGGQPPLLPAGGQPPLLPAGGQPPLLPGAASATTTHLDARAPVQESLPKTLTEQESPQPPLPGSRLQAGASDGRGAGGHLPLPAQAAPPELGGRAWLSRPQHPVCVDNGCFGNSNHLRRGTPGSGLPGCPPPGPAPRNQPEENVYISADSPGGPEGSVGRGGTQPPGSSLKNEVVPSSEHGQAPGSNVDVRGHLLQQRDAEQKRVGMLPGDGGDGAETRMGTSTPVAAPAPRDVPPSFDASLKPPVQEEKLPVGKMASSFCSMPTVEKVLPASVDPLLRAAGSFDGTSGRMASRESSATTIWAPCSNVERDVEVSKPGVLLSVAGESPEVAGRCPTSRGPSGPHPTASSSLTFSSDPLLVSTDSSSSGGTLSRVSSSCPAPAAHADPEEEEAAGASRDSHPPPSLDNTSLGNHELHVDHYPSTQLQAGNDLRAGAVPLGTPPVSDRSGGRGAATNSPGARVPSGGSSGWSLPSLLPAVGLGIAVLSAVAFLAHARLRR